MDTLHQNLTEARNNELEEQRKFFEDKMKDLEQQVQANEERRKKEQEKWIENLKKSLRKGMEKMLDNIGKSTSQEFSDTSPDYPNTYETPPNTVDTDFSTFEELRAKAKIEKWNKVEKAIVNGKDLSRFSGGGRAVDPSLGPVTGGRGLHRTGPKGSYRIGSSGKCFREPRGEKGLSKRGPGVKSFSQFRAARAVSTGKRGSGGRGLSWKSPGKGDRSRKSLSRNGERGASERSPGGKSLSGKGFPDQLGRQ